MKVGVLTFHRAINYGAVLQSYALCETIKKNGHEVEIIDYRPEYVERHRQILQIFNLKHTHGFTNLIKGTIITLLGVSARRDANKRFNDFIEHNLHLSKIVRNSNSFESKYDAIIFGSDQIWNPQICYGFDDLYWGRFPHENTQLITYAASIGEVSELTSADWNEIGKRLGNFLSISVRERQLKEELERRFCINATCNVDPSLLLGREQYDKLVEEPTIKGKYVAAFTLVETPNFMEYANKVSKEIGCPLVVISARKTLITHEDESIQQICPTVGGFLGLIKNAECVVTTSFHGTVFSVIFNRPFYTAAHGKSSRVYSLLSSIGLERRIVDMKMDNSFKFELINYEEPQKKLSLLVNDSKSYLSSLINK